VSYLTVLIAVLSSLGAGGIAGLAVMFVRERRLSRVTDKCLAAKTKAEKDHTLEVLRTLTQAAGRDGDAKARRLPQPRKSATKRLTGGLRALPAEEAAPADPETSTAA
jgi:hypothetical protein